MLRDDVTDQGLQPLRPPDSLFPDRESGLGAQTLGAVLANYATAGAIPV